MSETLDGGADLQKRPRLTSSFRDVRIRRAAARLDRFRVRLAVFLVGISIIEELQAA